MSAMTRAALRTAVGAGAAALAVTVMSTTAAHAAAHTAYQSTPTAAKNDADSCRFSLDGHTWASAAQFRTGALVPTGDGKVSITVRAARDHTCTVALASYGAHGATWQTSGKQVFQDFDTVTVAGQESGTLTTTVPGPGCFAQIDLYVGDVRHDGVSGDLPEGPDHPVFGNGLIAAWHGGTQTCAATPSAPAESTPSASNPVASTPQGSTSSAPTPLASVPPVSSPTPTPLSPTPAAPMPSTTATAAAISSDSVGGSLAHTGSSNTVPLVGGAAILLAAGGGLFVAARRRRAASKH
ncbi:LAETG motif-containing sortase-dependent surface protein [Streptomyces sp. NPDC096057]|uniref:LAETG motif-containing sortase-dependent surface protein n=1 Tax=Streptomyces sp. NPDC096057 TaxID=3155543 RepID=UPI0033185B07